MSKSSGTGWARSPVGADQRARWKRALADHHARQRGQRGRERQATAYRPGMGRVTQLALDFSGTRPLSEVLDQAQVVRAKRDASLCGTDTAYVYGMNPGDGKVIRYAITRWTPKRVYFEVPWGEIYAPREPLERDGKAAVPSHPSHPFHIV